ncbi:MAG: hypothetical protein NTV84_00505, partial [Methanoregula sp.]|nr:hypothetical protein [Methanoregula sp.]
MLIVILPVSADNRENGTGVVSGSVGEPQSEITQSPKAIETAVVTGSMGSDNIMGTSLVATPVVGFTGTPTSGVSPLTVAFTDTSTNTPTGWAWYFGDENWAAPAWTQVNASAGWSFRSGHSSVATPDGRIVVMGGFNNVTGLIN